MAFLNINDAGQSGIAVGNTGAARETLSFTQLEWTVVALTRRDTQRRALPHLVEAFLRGLLGTARDPELANPRLEVLRRTALSVRRWGTRLPDDIISAFHDAGYSRAQLTTLIRTAELDIVAGRNGRLA